MHVVGRLAEFEELGPLQARVIELRLRGYRWSAIAQALRVSVQTIIRWRHAYPQIDGIIAHEAHDRMEAAAMELGELVPKALRALDREMENPDPVAGKVRVAAARAVLAQLRRAKDGEDPRGPAPQPIPGVTRDRLIAALSALPAGPEPELGPANDNAGGDPPASD